jgi:hypothetical protein
MRTAPEPNDADYVVNPEEEPAKVCVFGFPGEPRTIIDRHKFDLLPVDEKESRAEPVHTREKRQAKKSFASENFYPAA